MFRWLLKYAKGKLRGKNESMQANVIGAWVNMTNKEQFAPIHYASFNGNLEICQMLIEEGANWQVTNRYGLNCLHTAA